MKVYVIRDGVFTLRDGRPSSNLLHYDAFPKRYLSSFSQVLMIGRLFRKEDSTAKPVTGPDVNFIPLPGYHGPLGFLKKFPEIVRVIWGSIDKNSAYILRVPTTVPSLYSIILYARRIPFAVEVAADPYDGYSAESLGNHPLSPFFQWAFTRLMRWQCRSAVAVAYVTRSALQKRYPARSAQASFSFTSIDLIPRAFASQPRVYNHKGDSAFKLVIIGNMQKTLKGHDILLKSLAKLREEGRNVFLTIIGYGENLEFYKSMASSLGLTESVNFTGKLENGDPIRDVLDKSDLFVLPSRQEGLPRALLEAMARGLPAVASRVGGTPELLEDYALVEANDTNGLTERIRYFMDCPERMSKESIRNLGVARTYSSDKVKAQRDLFFDYVKEHSGAA